MIYIMISFLIISGVAIIEYYIGYSVGNPLFGFIIPLAVICAMIYVVLDDYILAEPVLLVVFGMLIIGFIGAWFGGRMNRKSN
jgi:hypothetical protein